MKILHIVGARPNFMKAAPVITAMKRARGFRQMLVHTGQHYDDNMSGNFFRDLNLPRPDINLGASGGTHASQTAEIMKRLEPVLLKKRPDWVVVYGDVNSTVACALVAAKLGIRIAHVEAGLRSFDRTMPEEINRIVTDHLSDLLFVSEPSGLKNLRHEGIDRRKVHFTGNVMIDSLVRLLPKAKKQFQDPRFMFQFSGFILHSSSFVLVTLHRPCNVDDPKVLKRIVGALEIAARSAPVIFPVHPRTRKMLQDAGYRIQNGEKWGKGEKATTDGHRSTQIMMRGTPCYLRSSAFIGGSVFFCPPLGYLDFLALEANARLVVTDSGGVQEETTYLGVPCLTVRPNTERPVTVTHGTNQLAAADRKALSTAIMARLREVAQSGRCHIDFWDGHAAERITAVFRRNALARKSGNR